MAKFVIRNPFVELNGTDLSDKVSEVTINMSAADVDVTASGADGVERLPGLRDDSFEITFRQDFAASEVDATVFPLFDGGTEFEVRVAHNGGTISATNPSYEGNVIITEYAPLAGSIGDAGNASLSLPVSGKISRATT